VEALIGSTLGSHKLTAPLGTGTTGQCFAAVDGSGAPATVKVLHSALSLFTKVEGYWDELQKVASLSHPHIVAPLSADWSKSGRFYLVSDPLEGVDLHAALAQHGRLPASQVLLFAGQVCLALEAAHAAGHVHGAVKPHNIFLVRRGTEPSGISTRLLDFATGRLVTTATPGTGTPGGPGVPDPAYLAPEQFKGPATPASDLYALGVILYEALSGRRPFVGSYEQLAKLHAGEAPLPPANIPAGLREVVLKALSKDPKDRYPDAGELLAAIEGWAATTPPELDQPGVPLFAKAEAGGGVAQGEGEQTVKVAIDELSAAMGDNSQPGESEREVLVEPPVGGATQTQSEKKKQPMADAKKSKPAEPGSGATSKAEVPQDHELAAIAEKATSSLRAERASREEKPAPAPAKPAPEVEAYFDEDDELVELPLEKSVKAFVATLSPIVAPPSRGARPGGNGESLDAALDQFVRDAKAMSAVLPPPVMDDRRLAALAKIPVEEPTPAPAPAAPVALVAPVAAAPAAEPPRSILVPSVLSFLIGGALVFGAYKLFLEKPAVVDGTGGSGTGAVVTPPPAADKGTPAATPLADGTSASAARPEAGAAAATSPDGAPAAASKTPDAGAAAAVTPDAGGTAPIPKKVAKKIGKKVAKKAAKKAVPAVAKKKVEPKVKGKKKDKKGGSDWVDPFSQ
jgi:serine/threonine-protein kinase